MHDPCGPLRGLEKQKPHEERGSERGRALAGKAVMASERGLQDRLTTFQGQNSAVAEAGMASWQGRPGQ